jgi:hypothetical protein
MPDARSSEQGLGGETPFKSGEFAFGPASREDAFFERCDAGGVIAAIFKPPKRIENARSGRFSPQDANNTTHVVLLSCKAYAASRPGFDLQITEGFACANSKSTTDYFKARLS